MHAPMLQHIAHLPVKSIQVQLESMLASVRGLPATSMNAQPIDIFVAANEQGSISILREWQT